MPDTFAMRGYAICTAPRSGSNYLCQLLTSTGQLGRPLEYFNGLARRTLDDPDFPDDPTEQVKKICSTGTTANGIFAVKLFAFQHDTVSRSIKWTEQLPNLKFVLLKRRDIIGQAISWALADQTGKFRSTQSAEAIPVYNSKHILRRLEDIVTEYSRWDLYFALNNLHPLTLTYEDVRETPQKIVENVGQFMDADRKCAVNWDLINLRVQSDAVTANWRERFLTDHGQPDHIPRLVSTVRSVG